MAEPCLATIAADAFRARQAIARQQVSAGKVDAETAVQHLLPWLAIACRLGADLPDIEDDLAHLRLTDTWGEASLRAGYADNLCHRSRWVPVLAAARDKAVFRAEALPPSAARDAAMDEARGLVRLAEQFSYDINGKHHMPPLIVPQPQRKAA